MGLHSSTTKSISALIFLILLVATYGYCDCQVTLQWNPNNQAPAGYRLYGREEGSSYNYDEPWWEGDQSFTQCTIDQLDENTTYYFVVRAFDAADNESYNSNEAVFNYNGTTGISSSLGSGSTGGGGGGGCFITSLINP